MAKKIQRLTEIPNDNESSQPLSDKDRVANFQWNELEDPEFNNECKKFVIDECAKSIFLFIIDNINAKTLDGMSFSINISNVEDPAIEYILDESIEINNRTNALKELETCLLSIYSEKRNEIDEKIQIILPAVRNFYISESIRLDTDVIIGSQTDKHIVITIPMCIRSS